MPPTFRIFVTGFGPFPDGRGGQYEDNASHLLTRLLPSSLPARSAQNPSGVNIEIVNQTSKDGSYVKTEYEYIRQFCAELHGSNEDESIDLYLHIGMAGGWDFVAVERAAYRQDMTSAWAATPRRPGGQYYMSPDNVGKTVMDAGKNPWTSLPMGLCPDLDIDEVVDKARAALACSTAFDSGKSRSARTESTSPPMPVEIKAHADPGTYCCGFIFYESLANRSGKKRSGNVLFCHIPGETDDAALCRARDGILAVMTAAADHMVTRERRNKSQH